MDAPEQHSALVWGACPALLLAVCMGCGIVAADRLPGLGTLVWIGLAVLSLLLLGISGLPLPRAQPTRNFLRLSAAGLLALSLGAAAFRQQHTPAGNDISRLLSGNEVHGITLTGRVQNQPSSSPRSTRFYLAVQHVGDDPEVGASGTILVVLYPEHGEQARPLPALREGVLVQLRGQFSAIDPLRNPADFDYRRYLFLKGITRRLSVSGPGDVVVLSTDRGLVDRAMEAVREHTDSQIAAYVPGRRAQILVGALLLGDRTAMDADVQNDFRRTGLTHLLAVSGLHMVLIGMVLYGLLGPLLTRLGFAWRAREVIRFAIVAAVMSAYALLTGASPSAMRAAVMAVVLLGGNVLQRTSHPMNSLGVAALVLLGANAADLYDLGFQLSFAAVAGLVLLYPVFMHPFEACSRPVRKLIAALSVSLAATLATAPILFSSFGYVSIAGLFLNLVAVPLTSILMISGLFTVLAATVSAAAASSFGAACGALAHALLLLANAGNDYLSWAAVQGRFFTGWEVAAMVAALGGIAGFRAGRLRWRLACSTLVLVAAGTWSGVLSGKAAPRLQVLFFDVEQGDAALVLTPNRHAFLVDTGPADDWGDAGTRTILPHLRRYGIRELDAIVITHPHLDHIGGLASVLRGIPVRRLINSVENNVHGISVRDTTSLAAEALRLADSLHMAVRQVHTGDTLRIDETIRIGVLGPTRSAALREDVNETSVVLRVAYGRNVFLLLGDADADAEYDMATRYGALLRSDVVKVGHHGSGTSSSPAFVALARPDTAAATIAVVSVGRHNRYGLPDSTVMARWQRSGASVLTTASEGAIWLESDGEHVWRNNWR